MIVFEQTIPVLRIFDVDKAKEFYVGYLGLQIDWEHHFEANTPLYMQVSRGPLVLHLSEHYGDGSPGIAIFVRMRGVEEFHKEVSAKNYKYLRPGVTHVHSRSLTHGELARGQTGRDNKGTLTFSLSSK